MAGKADIIGVIEGSRVSCFSSDKPADTETAWHLVGGAVSDYNTLCGIDADDPEIGHHGTVRPKRGQKVTCSSCIGIYRHIKSLRISECDFEI